MAGFSALRCSTASSWCRSSNCDMRSVPPSLSHRKLVKSACKAGNTGNTNSEEQNPGLGLKAVWYGAEQFGNVVGLLKPQPSKVDTQSQGDNGLMSRQEVIASLKADYDENYFVSGKGEMAAYEPDCLFADPFAGFNGVERFKRNVSNLGGLMEDVSLEVLDWREEEDRLATRWRFSAVLQLPWRPRLAAAGGTVHHFSPETGRVVKHIESWDVEPGKVVKQLLRPANRMPGNQAETFMLSLSEGDLGGVWLASSRTAVLASLPVVAVSLAVKVATGEGLQGVFLGTVEGLAYLALLAGLVTEAVKTVKGF